MLNGLRVLGDGDELATCPKARSRPGSDRDSERSGPQMKRILEKCTAAGIPYKTIPGLAEMIEEDGLARQIRDVAVEDLLGRYPVRLEQDRISAKLQGQVILVTGAAGSIGSEICRQIARFKPAAIVGFEIAESPMFNLQQEFARSFPGVNFHAEIGSIQNPGALAEVFERYRPSVVYHAAAYKHVPLMESHIFEAIENNIFGTLNVVEAARKQGVCGIRDDFVRQGGAARQRNGRDEADRGIAGAFPSAGRWDDTYRCDSATFWAVTAAWCRSSRSRSPAAGRSP